MPGASDRNAPSGWIFRNEAPDPLIPDSAPPDGPEVLIQRAVLVVANEVSHGVAGVIRRIPIEHGLGTVLQAEDPHAAAGMQANRPGGLAGLLVGLSENLPGAGVDVGSANADEVVFAVEPAAGVAVLFTQPDIPNHQGRARVFNSGAEPDHAVNQKLEVIGQVTVEDFALYGTPRNDDDGMQILFHLPPPPDIPVRRPSLQP